MMIQVDIQSLKNNVAQLKKVELEIKRDRDKLTHLDQMMDLKDLMQKNKEQIDTNGLIDQLNWVEKREAFIHDQEELLTSIEKKLDLLRDQKSQIDQQLEDTDQNILNLERSKSDNDISRTLDNYKEALRKKSLEYDTQKDILNQLKEALDKEFRQAKELLNFIPSTGIKAFVDYYQANEDQLESEGITTSTKSFKSRCDSIPSSLSH